MSLLLYLPNMFTQKVIWYHNVINVNISFDFYIQWKKSKVDNGNVDDIDNVNKILFICYMHKSKQFWNDFISSWLFFW